MSIFDLDLDLTAPDWPWWLGHRFLDAAQQCGFTCDRNFVSDRQQPESPPPSDECSCQLAVNVTPGVDRPANARPDDPTCLPVFTADVTLTVDLCVKVYGSNEEPDPDEIDAAAKVIEESLWKIMQGLMRGRSSGTIAGSARLTFGPWVAMGDNGGSARWQTRWQFRQ